MRSAPKSTGLRRGDRRSGLRRFPLGSTSRASVWAALAQLLLGGVAAGASDRPLLRFYPAPGHPQYWAVAQDSRGVLYFGTGDGLLEYDGASWRVFPLPLEGAVRSIAAAADGALYVGSQGDFGAFELTTDGDRRFVSLRERVAPSERDFEDVWKTYATAAGVFFQTNERIFRWRNGELRSWAPSQPSARFHFSFLAGDRPFVLDEHSGLLALEDDELRPVPGGERFAGDRLYALLELPAGLLVGFREHGLLLHADGRFAPFAPDASAYLAEHRLYHAALLPDGAIALATLTGGVVVLEADGRLRQVIDRAAGLASNKVSYLFVDREEALWLAQDGGVTRVDLAAPFALYGPDETGGMVLTIASVGARLFVGTSSGLRVGDLNAQRLELGDGGIAAPVFDLAAYDDTVLAATNDGVFLALPAGARRLAAGISTSILRSTAHPGRLYVGQIDGVRLLQGAGDVWRDEGLLPGVAADVRSLLEEDGRLWIGTKSDGLFRAEPGAGGSWVVQRFGAEHGFVGAADVWPLRGRPVFLSTAGIRRFDRAHGRFEREPWSERAPELAHRRPTYLHEEVATGAVWVISRPGDSKSGPNYAVHLFEGELLAPSLGDGELRRLGRSDITTVRADASGVWFGAKEDLVRFEPRRVRARTPAVAAPICRRASTALGARDELRSGTGSVRIDCALPAFVDERSHEYRFRLVGVDAAWSDWGTSGTRVLSQLPAGRRELQVQARDALGVTSAVISMPLAVAPRWHERWSVRLAALAALALLLWTAVAMRLAALRAGQRRLEAIVAERTRELRASEAQYRRLFDNAADIIFTVDAGGTIRTISPAVEHVLGYAPEQVRGTSLHDLVTPGERARLAAFLERAAAGRAAILEVVASGKDGSGHVLQLTARRLDAAGEVVELEGIARDVTEQRALENQFRQSQKMEAVGQLAGGVAHDFNNLLTVIMGNCELMLEAADADAREGLNEIQKAAERAASLTRQLLAFSRRQRLKLEVLALNDVIAELWAMLRRVIGETIVLKYELAPELWPTRADLGQVTQVLMNLIVNARDAMPDGGELEIATANVTISQPELAAALELPPGDYVLLKVSDTGEGMDEQTRLHAFEPFFTTKEQGQGTGLGLSTVFGIVKQLKGSIALESALGHGTTFSIYLPRALDAAPGPSSDDEAPARDGARARVLVAEDEAAIRTLLRQLLRSAGYEVTIATGGTEALELAQGRDFDLLISDVVMPGLSGPELARRLRALLPDLKLLFMTGYATPAKADSLLDHEVVLEKPFSSRQLLGAVRELLAASPARG